MYKSSKIICFIIIVCILYLSKKIDSSVINTFGRKYVEENIWNLIKIIMIICMRQCSCLISTMCKLCFDIAQKYNRSKC